MFLYVLPGFDEGQMTSTMRFFRLEASEAIDAFDLGQRIETKGVIFYLRPPARPGGLEYF
jgi:hypothetical protein